MTNRMIIPSEKQKREITLLIQDRMHVGAWIPDIIDEIVDILNRDEMFSFFANMYIKSCKVLHSTCPKALGEEINQHIKEGWIKDGHILIGGPLREVYTQSMVKYDH